MPDFGMGQQQGMKNARTATEISQIGALMGQSTDLRARIFRISLGYVYRQAYSVLCQFGKKSLNYYFNQAFGTVPPEALEVEYAIHPSGSADGINKAVQYQKAFSRMQLLSGNPYVDQPSLVRSVLEIDDPALVGKLLTDPNLRGQDEKEEQAKENLIMESGYPVAVKPQDDHKAHVEVLLGRIQLLSQQGGGSQQSQQLYGQHLEAHLQGLGQTDKNAERQIRGMLRKQAQAMQGQAQGQMPQGLTSTQSAPQAGMV
jgi:hypothetical protein